MKEKKGFVTIGHGNLERHIFIQALLGYKVDCIVDVRSSPYSRHNPSFNREILKRALLENNISYNWLGDLLGGRPEDLSVYDENGIVDYEKLVQTKPFLKGLETLEKLSLINNVAIMCSENDPMKCHRFLAISRELSRRGFRVVHIKDVRTIIKQAALEDALVKLHFGENIQIDLFDGMEDNLEKSYSKQNKLCAYRRK